MIDANAAREAARRIFKRISFQDGFTFDGNLPNLRSVYLYYNAAFKPNQNDIKLYEQVLDSDRDGKVTLKDLQNKAIQYLCNNSVLNSISSTQEAVTPKNTTVIDNTSKYLGVSDNLSSFAQSSYSSTSQPGFMQYSQPPNFSSSLNSDGGSYNYNYKSSFQLQNKYEPQQLGNFSSTLTSNYQYNSSHDTNSYASSSKKVNDDYSNNFVNQSYSQLESERAYPQSEHSHQSFAENQEDANMRSQNEYSQQNQEQDRPYSENLRQYLSYLSKLFVQYANQVDFTVSEKQVGGLLSDTYAVLGREGYVPSEQDVRTWINLCDQNQDGKVEYQQYELFVIKSLKRSGLNLYD